MDDGHCGLPHEELLTLTKELLKVPAELVETALGLELQDGAVIADDLDDRRCVFLASLYRAEREIAEKLQALSETRLGPRSTLIRLFRGSKSGLGWRSLRARNKPSAQLLGDYRRAWCRQNMISSTMPSAKYSCSRSPLRLAKGNTAIDGLSGSAKAGVSGAIADTGPVATL